MRAFNIQWVIDFDEVYDLFDSMDDKQAAEKLGLSEKDYIKLFKEDRDSLIYEKYRKRQGELEQLVGLPNEVELPAEITTDEDATEWLSSEYGYFINGYELDTDYQEEKAQWSNEARQISEALREFAKHPEAIDNFESYLSRHFGAWLEKYAETPERMAGEFRHFASIHEEETA